MVQSPNPARPSLHQNNNPVALSIQVLDCKDRELHLKHDS